MLSISEATSSKPGTGCGAGMMERREFVGVGTSAPAALRPDLVVAEVAVRVGGPTLSASESARTSKVDDEMRPPGLLFPTSVSTRIVLRDEEDASRSHERGGFCRPYEPFAHPKPSQRVSEIRRSVSKPLQFFRCVLLTPLLSLSHLGLLLHIRTSIGERHDWYQDEPHTHEPHLRPICGSKPSSANVSQEGKYWAYVL